MQAECARLRSASSEDLQLKFDRQQHSIGANEIPPGIYKLPYTMQQPCSLH